ncbi:MAG TPA: hypothetical protein VN032_02170, partial [Thermoanaerobaculia bacterium]|nr:hypothetical protein [Thermoanaerobaculia bacterium]
MSETSEAPFLPPPPPSEPRRSPLGGAWPFYAAGVLVAATLLAVYVMLHPRHAGASGADAGIPATVTAEEGSLQREPSPKGSPLATLAQGKRVRVLAESARWVEVEADSTRGFLPADAIERDADRDARDRRAKTLLAFAPVYGVVGEDTEIALAPYPLAARGG